MDLGVIILTGGASSRMGTDKAALPWNGRRAVDRLADLAVELGAQATVTVGARAFGLPYVVEDPPGGGPVAGLLAGAEALRAAGCHRGLVLAVDAPTLRMEDLAPLLVAQAEAAAYEDLHLPLVTTLAALPCGPAAGWSMRRLIDGLGVVRLAPPEDAALRLRGANTPAERDDLLAQLVRDEARSLHL